MIKRFRLAVLFLVCAGLTQELRAIDPSELILSIDGLYARPLGPQRYADGYYGFGGAFSVERALNSRYSVGGSFTTLTFTEQGGNRLGMSSLDLIGRRWFGNHKAFNPYLQLGLGGNLFKDGFKQPFGDVLHVQAALGSHYVFDTHWALNYALEWHVMAPFNTPHHWVGARLGLSYRYGTQPRVNRIAPNPRQAMAMEVLREEKVSEVVGRVEYKVKPGDNLHDIAAGLPHWKRAILWPLIYNQNREVLKDPHLIQPDQVLTIKRNYSEEDVKEARRLATGPLYKRPTAAP